MKRDLPLNRPVHVPMTEELVEQIDEWRRRQRDLPNRAEAVRRLVEIGLKNEVRKE